MYLSGLCFSVKSCLCHNFFSLHWYNLNFDSWGSFYVWITNLPSISLSIARWCFSASHGLRRIHSERLSCDIVLPICHFISDESATARLAELVPPHSRRGRKRFDHTEPACPGSCERRLHNSRITIWILMQSVTLQLYYRWSKDADFHPPLFSATGQWMTEITNGYSQTMLELFPWREWRDNSCLDGKG